VACIEIDSPECYSLIKFIVIEKGRNSMAASEEKKVVKASEVSKEEFLYYLEHDTEKGFKKITLEDMVDFLKAHGTREEKDQFKVECMKDKDGNTIDKYNHLVAVRWFCGKFIPNAVPKRKDPKASDLLKELD
jgi:predicted transcriptional regulator